MISIRFLMFLGSLFLYLAGVVPFSYFGMLLPLGFFLWWAIEASLPRALSAGLLAGLLWGVYTPLPFGFESAVLMALVLLFFLGKRWMETHYLWGDFILVTAGLLAGDLLFFISQRAFGAGASFRLPLFLKEIVLIGLLGLGVFFLLRRIFRDGRMVSRPYTM